MSLLRRFLLMDPDNPDSMAGLDQSTDTLQTIGYAHHEIHAGSMYRVQAFNDSLADGGTLVIAFKTADTDKLPHFDFEWEAEDKCVVELLEGVSTTVGTGADRSPKNSRRGSSNTSGLRGAATGAFVSDFVTVDPTIAGGSVISLKKVYSNSRAGGGSGSRKNEIILARDTEYALRVTNEAGTAKGYQIRCEWYEHTDRN